MFMEQTISMNNGAKCTFDDYVAMTDGMRDKYFSHKKTSGPIEFQQAKESTVSLLESDSEQPILAANI